MKFPYFKKILFVFTMYVKKSMQFALLFFFVFTTGIFILSKNVIAQSTCSYYAETQVRLDSRTGPFLSISKNNSINFGASNNKQYAQNNSVPAGLFGMELSQSKKTYLTGLLANSAVYKYYVDPFIVTTSGYQMGEKASVTLMGLNSNKYEITGKFCSGFGCPQDISTQPVDDTITNFVIQCNINVQYGWVVKEKTTPSITSIPTRVLTNFPSPTPTTFRPTITPIRPTLIPTNTPPSPTQPPITDDCLVYHRGSKSKTSVVILAEKDFNNQEFLNHVSRQVSDFTNSNLKDHEVLDYISIVALNPQKYVGFTFKYK